MSIHSNGIVTGSDGKLIADNRQKLIEEFPNSTIEEKEKFIQSISYRPFEVNFIWNDPKLVGRNRNEVMRHYQNQIQIGLLISKQVRDYRFAH